MSFMSERFGKRHEPSEACAPDCFGCKTLGIRFSGEMMPNRKPEVHQQNSLEKQQTRDNESYRRLRKAGVQPARVTGCADAEQFSSSRFEIETFHRLSSSKVGKKYDETQAMLTGHDGFQPLPQTYVNPLATKETAGAA